MVGRTVPSGVCRNAPGAVTPGTGLPNPAKDHEYKAILSP